MSGPFMFGVHRGRLDAKEHTRRERIARKHGCTYVSANVPGTGPISWFEGRNLGEPFNRDTAARVSADLEGGAS